MIIEIAQHKVGRFQITIIMSILTKNNSTVSSIVGILLYYVMSDFCDVMVLIYQKCNKEKMKGWMIMVH
jgi:hypothetical protein